MLVQKEKKYELTFKNLRRREIPCLVIAVPQKNKISSQSEIHSSNGTYNGQNKNRSKILKRLKQKLKQINAEEKKAKSLLCLDTKRDLSSKVIKKRVYRRKSLQKETSLVQKPPPTPPKETTALPLKKTTASPLKESTASPLKETTTTPLKETTASPLKESTASPLNKTTAPSLKETTLSTLKETTTEVLKSTSDVGKRSPVAGTEPPKKRTYRKKIHSVATITPISGSLISTSTAETYFGTPVITPETPKKRVYRKRLKIPAVPHNTPVLCSASDGDSSTSMSFLNHSQVITIGKLGRGRPRLSASGLGSDYGDESTMSQGSDKGSVIRRGRKSLWAFDSDCEDEDENQVSEYELLRQRNIEENLKKLRELFSEQGLQFEEKSSETPKKRKSYTKVPLPPPRPRSQRLEMRMPFDFSELDEKLSMSEAAFM